MGDGKRSGADFGLLVLRLALGGIMIAHGVMKIIGPGGVNGWVDFVAKLGVPFPQPSAYAALVAELAGGLFVVTGILARFGALGIAATMVVAAVKVHFPNGFFLRQSVDAAGAVPNGCEYTVALFAMAVCILFAGPGGLRIPFGKSGG